MSEADEATLYFDTGPGVPGTVVRGRGCPGVVAGPVAIETDTAAELEELRADRDRLDWLEREAPLVGHLTLGGTTSWQVYGDRPGGGAYSGTADTLRSAIDAARASQAAPGGPRRAGG